MRSIKGKSVLLCDAGFSAIPILETLKQKGFTVGVCGARPSDPGHSLADQSFLFDYSDSQKLLNIFLAGKFDYLIPGCTDISYKSCAWVANQLNLPGYDQPAVAKIFTQKNTFRQVCKAHQYPVPAHEMNIEKSAHLNFPVLLKPRSSFSGRGIEKFAYPAQLKKYIQTNKIASKKHYLLEEFVGGQLYSHSAFLRSGSITAEFFVSEFCTIHPYQVNSSHLATQLSKQIKHQVSNWLECFARDFDLADGLLHTQFISDGNQLYLIECCRRCPGDLYSLLIKKSTGIDYARYFISPYIQSKYPNLKKNQHRFYSRHTLSTAQSCIYLGANLQLPGVQFSYIPLKKIGDQLSAAPYDRAGIFFIEHSSKSKMEKITPELFRFTQVETIGSFDL
jgi:biotin carboxylase